MDTAFVNLLLHTAGGVLVVFAGYGAGLSVCWHHRTRWRQLHTVARLLRYWQGILQYQALTGAELLHRAQSYKEFSCLGLQSCTVLSELPLPAALLSAQRAELRDGLCQMALQPRKEACSTLERLAALCETAAQNACRDADAARTLWPRLGLCIGILIVILLW